MCTWMKRRVHWATSGMQSKLQRRHSGLTFPTHETPSRMRRASAVTLQHHQTLPLPRKMTLMIDAPHIWNILYNARSNTSHHPTSPKTSLATKKYFCKIQENFATNGRNAMRNAVTACMIRHQSENNPRRKCQSTPALQPRLLFAVATSILRRKNAPFCAPASNPNFKCRVAAQTYSTSNITKYCACQEKLTLMIDPRHRWKVLYLHCTEQYAPPSFNPTKCCACHEKNIRDWPSSHMKRENIAQCNRRHHPTPSNIAPVTQNDLHDWSSWHMECPVQCTKQQRSPSNITKYDCIRQEERLSWLILFDNARSNGGYLPSDSKIPETCAENRWNVFALRERSDHDPRIKPSVHTCLTTEVTFSAHHGHFVLKNKRLRAPTTIPNFIKWSGTQTLPNTAFAMQIILMIHNW